MHLQPVGLQYTFFIDVQHNTKKQAINLYLSWSQTSCNNIYII